MLEIRKLSRNSSSSAKRLELEFEEARTFCLVSYLEGEVFIGLDFLSTVIFEDSNFLIFTDSFMEGKMLSCFMFYRLVSTILEKLLFKKLRSYLLFSLLEVPNIGTFLFLDSSCSLGDFSFPY